MKKVGILYHPQSESARPLAEVLMGDLKRRGVQSWLCSAWAEEEALSQADGTGLLVSVGGDGTILRVAQVALACGAPITGVNTGNLGFMTELTMANAQNGLPDLLDGKGWLDERVVLEATRAGKTYYALNDVVLARGGLVRLVAVDVAINGEHFCTYRADGIILATATGCTGYALAASGPILHPQSADFVMVPIMPHLSPGYNLVLPQDAVIVLKLTRSISAMFNVDGHINIEVAEGERLEIKRSNRTVQFLRLKPNNSFYRTLEQKLRGKQSR